MRVREHGGVGQDHVGLILGLNLCYSSVHIGEGIHDFHPFICEHVKLHCDGDMDGSD